MRTIARNGLWIGAAVVALWAPSTGWAQRALSPVRVTVTAQADDLDRQAEELYGKPSLWRRAAYMHERAASMRAATDPQAYAGYRMAAHLYHAAGSLSEARAAMERAAVQASARGDVVGAANSYVDAGLVALEARQDDRVREFAVKAEALAGSPLLSAEQRRAILERVGYRQLSAAISQR